MAAIPTRYVFVTTRDLITSRVHHSAYLSRASLPRKRCSRVLRIAINQYTDCAGKPWVSRCQMTPCHEYEKNLFDDSEFHRHKPPTSVEGRRGPFGTNIACVIIRKSQVADDQKIPRCNRAVRSRAYRCACDYSCDCERRRRCILHE